MYSYITVFELNNLTDGWLEKKTCKFNHGCILFCRKLNRYLTSDSKKLLGRSKEEIRETKYCRYLSPISLCLEVVLTWGPLKADPMIHAQLRAALVPLFSSLANDRWPMTRPTGPGHCALQFTLLDFANFLFKYF